MAQCHWHPERIAQRECDLCHRPVCSGCSTQVAEPPESYRLCPECLNSLEKLVDRGLSLQAESVSASRAWLGALAGGVLALGLWVFVLRLIDPTWYSLVRWLGYVNCGLLSALLARRFTGNRRGAKVTIPAFFVTAVTILIGHYVSANAEFSSYLSANPDIMRRLVEVGAVRAGQGWWLPWSVMKALLWQFAGWKDLGVVAAALYLAYAFTHRLRVWQSHKNRPLSRTGDEGAPASG